MSKNIDKIKNENELLKLAVANAKINLDVKALQQELDMRRKESYLKMHNYNIWQGNNGYFYTILPDEKKKKKRKVIKRKNKDELEKAIIDFYIELEAIPSFKTCFVRWTEQKFSLGEIKKATYDRYFSEWRRFIEWNEISEKRISDISESELEAFIRLTISKQNLTAKAYSNMRTLIIGSFKYAKKMEYTDISISNFFGDLDLSKKSFRKATKGLQIFDEDEMPLILEWLRQNPTVENLGILLTFQTGLREGELSAIKFSDVKGNKMHVHSQEIKYKSLETGKYTHEFVEYTKTDAGDRYIYLSSKALETIGQIRALNPDNDYMMQIGDRKLYTNTFNDRLYKACDACGIPRRSMHKIRKTYGTILLDSEIQESLVMNQMGHSDIATTRKYYYYSNKNEMNKLSQIERAISY
ncbi:tyrosine-type recombinase/integrase [Butyrivibrio sp. AE3006]|uniref:tyrosine-type recombinase/integrase n=1 Tax=Butyrivibrio sp. AE3006 TaxID=1280673 RepID=UPI0004796C97|nr:site-specific integrase [Butyrivibrio sp. AE3006]